MQEHATDPDVFIRSMATRGYLGGLARATNDAIDLLDQAGLEIDPGVKAFTNAFTEMFWAQMESTVGQCEEFRQHIASARGFADGVPPIGREQVMAQIRETEASGCPRAVFGQP
jgi:hypothetical protein